MKKIKIILISLCFISFASCSDFLDRNPKGVQDETQFLKSPNAGYRMVIKAYHTLNDVYGYEVPRMILNNVCTDESEKGGSDAGDRAFDTDCSYGVAVASNEETTNFWTCMFKGIQRCNFAIDNLPSDQLVDDKGYPLTPEVRARYISEMKFLRAYFNFELYKIFGSLPILTTSQSVATAPNLKRSTNQETVDFIIKDLQEVSDEDALPSALSLQDSERGRVTKEAVWALQTKVYMYFAKDERNYFKDAERVAKKVIDSGAYELESNYQNLWLEGTYASREGIFTDRKSVV